MAEEPEEEGSADGWLISFADLMTLLFAAFVVLYGITPQGESKIILGVISSIRESFVEIPDEPLDESKISVLFEGKSNFVAVPPEMIQDKAIKNYNKSQSDLKEIDQHLKRVEVWLQQKSKGKGIQVSLRRATVADIDEFGLSLIFMGEAFYKGESIALSSEAKKYLTELGGVLKKMNRPLVVEGHTDPRPASGNLTNDEISALRADEVRNLLVKIVGIAAKKVHISSYGGSRPLGNLKEAEGEKDNDRIEIKVDYDQLDTRK